MGGIAARLSFTFGPKPLKQEHMRLLGLRAQVTGWGGGGGGGGAVKH